MEIKQNQSANNAKKEQKKTTACCGQKRLFIFMSFCSWVGKDGFSIIQAMPSSLCQLWSAVNAKLCLLLPVARAPGLRPARAVQNGSVQPAAVGRSLKSEGRDAKALLLDRWVAVAESCLQPFPHGCDGANLPESIDKTKKQTHHKGPSTLKN